MSESDHITEYSLFLERWRLHVEAAENRAEGIANNATTLGRDVLRALFVLNGAAAVAIPSFQDIGPIAGADIGSALISFLVGVATAVVGGFFGYFSLTQGSMMWWTSSDARRRSLVLECQGLPAETDEDWKALEKKRRGYYRRATMFEWMAIIACTISLGAFLFGALDATAGLQQAVRFACI